MKHLSDSVFVFGNFGRGNFGDDLMLCAFLSEIAQSAPASQILVAADNQIALPGDLMSQTSWVRWKPLNILQAIARTSDFVLCGGTHFQDFGGRLRWMRPLTGLAILFSFARLLNRRFWCIGMGVGPLERRPTRWVTKVALSLADYVSVRDQASIEEISRIHAPKRLVKGFDLAALGWGRFLFPASIAGAVPTTIGINVLPVYSIYFNDPAKDSELVGAIARHVTEVGRKAGEIKVKILVANTRPKYRDAAMSEELRRLLASGFEVGLLRYHHNPLEFIQQFKQCDYIIAMRLHCQVLAYLLDIPFLMIPYHPKCTAFAKGIELERSQVVSPSALLNGEPIGTESGWHEPLWTLPQAEAKLQARLGVPSLRS